MPDDNLYQEYRSEMRSGRMGQHAQMGAAVTFLINAAFVIPDWIFFPDRFLLFVSARSVLGASLAWVYFSGSKRYPQASQWVICLVAGAAMLIMILATEGANSAYYAGLILLFAGMGVLLPLTAYEALAISSTITGGFLLSPLVGGDAVDWPLFLLRSFFLVMAVGLATASCGFLDRIRLRDFARRREIEEARDRLRALDRAKSRFTANVHHELRTPLTLVLAPLDALLAGDSGAISPEVRAELKTMRANGTRLLKLINDLLELSRLENDARRLRLQTFDLGERVRCCLEDMTPLARRKKLTLSAAGLERIGLMRADPDAVERVIVNLLGNSVKFTPEGGTISVEGSKTGEGVLLEVADSGVGIPPEQLEKVFDRFRQVDSSATRTHEGTGIGLSLAKELVELHGGWIRAESPGVGQGTRMQVWFPLRDLDESEVEEGLFATEGAKTEERARASGESDSSSEDLDRATLLVEATQAVSRWEDSSGRGGSVDAAKFSGHESAPEVLVVEDNDAMRRLLASILSSEFRVRVARNGREALNLVGEREPSLVLTDIMMPELSGTELCRRLKNDPETRGIPVVLVTSKAEREMQIKGLELGADDYVVKPFHPRELSARVRSLVRLHELQVELARRAEELERALAELKDTEVHLVHAERMGAVGELAAGVAHEVNNPLNFARNALSTLRAYSEELAGFARRISEINLHDAGELTSQLEELEEDKRKIGFETLVSDLRELVDIVGEGLDRTARLVGDLRDFASPHRGEGTAVELEAGLRSTLELVGHRLREAGAELEEAFEPDIPAISGDAGALNQVFLNLLKNAAEAIEERGGGRIVVGARREGPEAVVRVQDDGPGMDGEVQARLFEPFFTTKSAGRGTGLGLSICRRIIEEHGGRIEVESERGVGTTVTVRIPAGEANAA